MTKPMDSYEIRHQFDIVKASIRKLEDELDGLCDAVAALEKKNRKPPLPRGSKPKTDKPVLISKDESILICKEKE